MRLPNVLFRGFFYFNVNLSMAVCFSIFYSIDLKSMVLLSVVKDSLLCFQCLVFQLQHLIIHFGTLKNIFTTGTGLVPQWEIRMCNHWKYLFTNDLLNKYMGSKWFFVFTKIFFDIYCRYMILSTFKQQLSWEKHFLYSLTSEQFYLSPDNLSIHPSSCFWYFYLTCYRTSHSPKWECLQCVTPECGETQFSVDFLARYSEHSPQKCIIFFCFAC